MRLRRTWATPSGAEFVGFLWCGRLACIASTLQDALRFPRSTRDAGETPAPQKKRQLPRLRRGELFLLHVIAHRLNHLVEGAGHDRVELVRGELDPVVRAAVLREVVRPD